MSLFEEWHMLVSMSLTRPASHVNEVCSFKDKLSTSTAVALPKQ
jgi:hypothetical protein